VSPWCFLSGTTWRGRVPLCEQTASASECKVDGARAAEFSAQSKAAIGPGATAILTGTSQRHKPRSTPHASIKRLNFLNVTRGKLRQYVAVGCIDFGHRHFAILRDADIGFVSPAGFRASGKVDDADANAGKKARRPRSHRTSSYRQRATATPPGSGAHTAYPLTSNCK